MNPADIPKTAIVTPFGTYTFNYSCFGLKNAGATFQRLMDSILGNLPFCVCYVDDILIFSKNKDEHTGHIREVLKRLQENGLIVKEDKCIFGATSVEFLGHNITAKGVTPLRDKVTAIENFPKPSTVKGLQEFLGMVTFYHRFLPNIAATLAPLNELLKGKPKALAWTSAALQAFDRAKQALAKATLLAFPAPNAELILTTDASNTAVGAALEQRVKGVSSPIAFFSKKLSDTETRYSTFDRELLAVHLATQHFKHLLEATQFKIQTDHLPLVHAFTKQTDPCSNRQRRQLSAISEFNCSFHHVPGKQNSVADALSRNCIATAQLGLSLTELGKLQKEESTDARKNTSLTWSNINIDDTHDTILCDISTGKPRPWIPQPLRKAVFNNIHNLAHPSIRTTIKMMTDRYVWSGISKDVRAWARSCLQCQKTKIHRHTESGIGTFDQPKRRFGHIHVDIVGPLPASNNYKYLFTMIDRSTRWPEAVPMKAATTEACIEALLNGWISRFGIPDTITSDRGAPFTSNLWTGLAQHLGVTAQRTTAYNPEANGMVERLHRTLKAALMARCNDQNWATVLPWILLGLRTTPKEGIEVSAAEMTYGNNLQVPGDFFPDQGKSDLHDIRHEVQKYIPCQQTYRNTRKTYSPPDLHTATHVFVRVDTHKPPLTPPYTGPFKVLQRNDKAFQLDIMGKPDWTSLDRLKPAYLMANDQPDIQFSRAGRPLRVQHLR